VKLDTEPYLNVVSLVDHLEHKQKINIQQYVGDKSFRKNPVFTQRLMAFGLDLIFLFILKILIINAYTSFVQAYFYQFNLQMDEIFFKNFGMVDGFISLSLFLTYFIFGHYSCNGKTPGKMIMKLTVIKKSYLEYEYTQEMYPSLKQSVIRTFGYFACYLSLGTLFLIPFFRKDKQSIPDFLSQTNIIEDRQLYELFLSKSKTKEVIQIDIAA